MAQVPARTAESDAMSRDLVRRGFKFVGSTIYYALIQATGIVSDHLMTCPGHAQLGGGPRSKVTKRAQLISSDMNATLNHDDKDNIQLSAVEDHDGILTIRGGGAQRDWNGIHYKQGMSAKNVGTTSLSANIATIPPGGVAYAHIHVGFEVILYILEGKVRHEFGPGLKQVLENEAGDFIYIKPGVPHEVFNVSDTEPVVAFVARSSADEWDNIIPYDRNRSS